MRVGRRLSLEIRIYAIRASCAREDISPGLPVRERQDKHGINGLICNVNSVSSRMQEFDRFLKAIEETAS